MPTIAFLIDTKTKDVKELGEVRYHTLKEADEELTQQCLKYEQQLKESLDSRIVFSSKSPLGRYEALMYAHYQEPLDLNSSNVEDYFCKDIADAEQRRLFSMMLNK